MKVYVGVCKGQRESSSEGGVKVVGVVVGLQGGADMVLVLWFLFYFLALGIYCVQLIDCVWVN